MKKYKAIFFDWDGTAVISRTAPVDDVVKAMKELLKQDIKLFIISGTTYENIAGGKIHTMFSKDELKNLYFGLGRGAFNYSFDEDGNIITLRDLIPNKEELLRVHDLSYEIHRFLLEDYNYATDIVFSRPNYCKIDLMVYHSRGEQLFLQNGEVDLVNQNLQKHGYKKGLSGLIDECTDMAQKDNLKIKITTDAKYLEIGVSTKTDNVDYFLEEVVFPSKIEISKCCFWGDEFTYIGDGIPGSDAFMVSTNSKGGDFFDVSNNPYMLPENVVNTGGGISDFINFLEEQAVNMD